VTKCDERGREINFSLKSRDVIYGRLRSTIGLKQRSLDLSGSPAFMLSAGTEPMLGSVISGDRAHE